MKLKYPKFKHAIFLFFLITLFSAVLTAQKKPATLKLDVDSDDMQLCGGQGIVTKSSQRDNSGKSSQKSGKDDDDNTDSDVQRNRLANSQFCVMFRSYYYNLNSGNLEGAQAVRNEMIELVRGQVDIFYKQRKDGRSSKIRLFSTILDFLRIGGEFAVTIMNGERAKTIVGAALGGLNSGQAAFNKNFQILQTQVLINKMNTNRAEIMTEIQTKKSLAPGDYSWYAAKNDLRRYLFAGTFDNALDTLVNETGADVANAERTLRIVEKRAITPAANKSDLDLATEAGAVRDAYETELASGVDARIAKVGEKLRSMIDELDEDPALKTLFEREGIDKTTADAQKIYDALDNIILELPSTQGRKGRDLVKKINQAFINNKLN